MHKLNQFNLLVSKSGVSVICPRSHSLIGAESGIEPRSLYPFPCFCHNVRYINAQYIHSKTEKEKEIGTLVLLCVYAKMD